MEELFCEAPQSLIDPVSMCVFRDPVISSVSGRTYSRATVEQYGMKDPITRDQLTSDKLVPNRDKAAEVDAYLDTCLQKAIGKIHASKLSEASTVAKTAPLIMAVAYRSDLSACVNAKRLLVETLQSAPDNVLALFRAQLTPAQLSAVAQLTRACSADKLALRLAVDDGAGYSQGASAAGGYSDGSDLSDLSDISSVSSASSVLERACLHVKNLSGQVTKPMLDGVFADYKSRIKSIHLRHGKDRKYAVAFVNFRTPEAAQEALGRLSNFKLQNRPLKLSLREDRAKPGGRSRRSRGARKSSSSSASAVTSEPGSVKVTFLDPSVTKDELEERFSKFGTVTSVNLIAGKPTNHAFVNFKERWSADAAVEGMHCHQLRGSIVQVKIQKKKAEDIPEVENEPSAVGVGRTTGGKTHAAKVENLSTAVKEEDLSSLFGAYGAIDSMRLIRPKGKPSYAYINYVSLESAQRASSELHGKRLFDREIEVTVRDQAQPGVRGPQTRTDGHPQPPCQLPLHSPPPGSPTKPIGASPMHFQGWWQGQGRVSCRCLCEWHRWQCLRKSFRT